MTYKMSQDPLEIFFSSIRACLGFNNNPNVVQFQAAYKKLCAGGILKSSVGNCLWDDDTKILTVKDDQDKDNDEQEECTSDLMDLNVHNSEYKENVLVYVAGFIQRKIIEHEKCNDCSSYLRSSDIVLTSSLIEQKDLGGLVKPSVEVYQLVRTANQMIEHFEKMCDLLKTKNSYQKILTKCLQ